MDYLEVFMFISGVIVGGLTASVVFLTIQLQHQHSEEYKDDDYFEE